MTNIRLGFLTELGETCIRKYFVSHEDRALCPDVSPVDITDLLQTAKECQISFVQRCDVARCRDSSREITETITKDHFSLIHLATLP